MKASPDKAEAAKAPTPETHARAQEYRLDAQVGYQLRLASQRHLGIFASRIPDLTPTQFAALARLAELGPQSQNALGRATAMDAATIKGVIDRLAARGLVSVARSETDRRRLVVTLTREGEHLFVDVAAAAIDISDETLAPLSASERADFLALLSKLT